MHHVINLTSLEVCAAFANHADAKRCADKFNASYNGRFQFVVAAFESGPTVRDWYAMNYRARAMAA